MSQEKAMRARVDGKSKTTARTSWSLDISDLRFRCLREADNSYVVQMRSTAGWKDKIGSGSDPLTMLRRLVNSNSIKMLT